MKQVVRYTVLMTILFTFASAGAAIAEESETDTDDPDALPQERLVRDLLSPQPPRVLAAEGPGEDRGAVALGLSMLGTVPTFDVRYVRGFGARFMVDGSASTIGVMQRMRLGARYLVLDKNEAGAFALRLSLMEAHSFSDDVVIAGAGPGLVYSFGDRVRVSASLDLAWSFLHASDNNPLGASLQVHPAIGVELPIDDQLNLMIEASALTAIDTESAYALPIFSAGLVW